MKRIKHITLGMILLSLSCQIVCYGQTDSAKFCYTSTEMNYWIGSALDAQTYKSVSDSLFNVVDSLNLDKRDLKLKNSYCDTLIQSQRELSLAYATELQLERKAVKRTKWVVRIWQGLTAIVSGVLLWEVVKPSS